MDDTELLALAGALFDAERERRAIPPISAGRPSLGAGEAYRIQQEIVRRRLAAGETVTGWKIGLTSKAMQDQLGVDQPDYGPILSGYMVAEGSAIPIDELIQPRIEAEIAFVLKESLRGPGVTAQDVLRATAGVAPAIEIIDSRIEGWKLTLPDTIADLASSARVAVGRLVPVDGIDLRLVGVVVERAGEVVGTGAGAAALGDSAAAVAWAANTLGALGVTLEAGHLIMPGALHASVPAKRGDSFQAQFDRLGSVSVRFE
jgi:2-keto-4-pentenoate hydratase